MGLGESIMGWEWAHLPGWVGGLLIFILFAAIMLLGVLDTFPPGEDK